MKVLVVAPHPDDEVLGCGGAILRHVDRGDAVQVVFLTSGELGVRDVAPPAADVREQEARQAAELLGAKAPVFLRRPDYGLGDDDGAVQALEPVITSADPDLVYVTHAGESHPDHVAAHLVVLRALGGRQPLVLLYEVWSPLPKVSLLCDISPVAERKLAVIRCYRSQLGQFRYDRAIPALNSYRGELLLGSGSAEAFGTACPPGGDTPRGFRAAPLDVPAGLDILEEPWSFG